MFILLSKFVKHNTKKLCLILCLFMPLITFANAQIEEKPLLLLKIYSEHNPKKTLSFTVTMPKGSYYSYYRGSDLPTWQYDQHRSLKGDLKSGQLVTIRLHHKQSTMHKQIKAALKIVDVSQSRIIWEGEIDCKNKGYPEMINTIIDRDKHFDVKTRFDKDSDSLWLELSETAN